MIAFGTLKKKSAFKLLARAKNIPAQTANEITKQIEKFETDLRYADDEDKDSINVYDYVDDKYHDYVKQSEEYWGVISDRKKAPSAYLLYQGSIRKEIGLIKCKSESTKKEAITCVIDGAVAEEFKFLKNDLLVVNVVDLVDRVFRTVGIEHFGVNELLEKVKDNKAVWDIYAKGLTMGINQCEKTATAAKCMRYKPKNVSELAAFIAGIRPGFKSMYPIFESRKPFSYGVATLDNMLITEELPIPFLIFQEQVMAVLNYAGYPMDQCYGLIKAIAKKKVEKVKAIKDDFITMFAEKIKIDENLSDERALELSKKVWGIVDDNAGYGFNSAHAYCMALDSLYCAYLKATYPYQFYQVLLTYYADKGNKDKVAELKKEMLAFGIHEGKFKFGNDNRRFVADEENKVIYSSLVSLKNMNQKLSEDLYRLYQRRNGYNGYNENQLQWLKDVKSLKSLKSDQLKILIALDYFSDFGTVSKLQKFNEIYDELDGRAQFSKDITKINECLVPYFDLIKEHSTSTEKMYKSVDSEAVLNEIWRLIPDIKQKTIDKIRNELDYIGYIQSIYNVPSEYYCVIDLNMKYNNKYTVTLHQLNSGSTKVMKIRSSTFNNIGEFKVGDVLKLTEISEEKKWAKNSDGDFIRTEETEEFLKNYLIAV